MSWLCDFVALVAEDATVENGQPAQNDETMDSTTTRILSNI